MQLIYNILGQANPYVPGYTSTYSSQITKTALLGPVALQGLQILYRTSERIINFGKILKADFAPRPGETETTTRERQLGNAVTLTLFAGVFTAATVYAVYAIKMGLLTTIANWVTQQSVVQSVLTFVSNFSFPVYLIPQNPNLIYGTYVLLGMTHLSKSVEEGSNIGKIKHLFAGAVGLATTYMMYAGHIPVTLTASALGLVCLLPDLQALNIFGTALTIDALSYWIKPNRDPFDFATIATKHVTAFVHQIAILSIIQKLTDGILRKSDTSGSLKLNQPNSTKVDGPKN